MSQPGFIKTACQACEGRLELPVDAVGVTFACPRCSTKLKLALKCACVNCKGPLSFEVGHIGHTIQCGHCEGSTPLMPSAIVVGDTPVAPEPEQSRPSAAVTQPLLQEKPLAAATQPVESVPTKKPAVTTQSSGGAPSAPKRPAPPKRPGGAGGPTAPVPQRPSGSGASDPPRRPVGEGVSGPPKRSESPKRPGGPTAPKRPDDLGAPGVPEGSPPKRPAEGDGPAVPEGVKPPGQAPTMPKMGGGSGDASSGPPKRPAAVAEPQKQGGVSSPSQAAASREAALAKSKEAALAASEADQGEEIQSEEKQQRKAKISAAFFLLTLIAGLAWFVVMPYFSLGGDDRFVKDFLKRKDEIYRPPRDASAIKVDPASLSVGTGDAGLMILKGSIQNGGKKPARNIKIILQIAGGAEPLEVTHTVNKEVKPGQKFEFSTPLSFDVPENAQITVKKVEIH